MKLFPVDLYIFILLYVINLIRSNPRRLFDYILIQISCIENPCNITEYRQENK